MNLPDLLPRQAIRERLQAMFPQGIINRGYLTRELAASTVFTALYIGAVEGSAVYLGPKHVYRMTDLQAEKTTPQDRTGYASDVLKGGFMVPGERWYQDTTREPIRDETLREGFVTLGVATERQDLPTTSSKPRYQLKADFAALFSPNLQGEALEQATAAWRDMALNKGALTRIAINRKGAGAAGDKVLVTFPNGETRLLKPGPSSIISKAVIEDFARRFLDEAAVIFLSESGNKVVARDDELAKQISLNIKADKDLPDIILVDLGPAHPLLAFVEVVASDGPISDRRKAALQALVHEAGFPIEHVAFVTAYLDRSAGPFKKNVDSLAWGSYAWFAAEPERLMILSEATGRLTGRI